MAQCLIIADDLTGANATGVLLHKFGYSADTILNTSGINNSQFDDFECLMYPTDSRSVSPDEAYKRVYDATMLLKTDSIKVYAKRIDSTLRGNLGQETDAMLDALGEKYIALVAPSFPSSGRIVCGGFMLVNSVPLHKTGAATDPKNPVTTSCVADIFKAQSKYPVACVTLEDLRQGQTFVTKLIEEYAREGVRNILFDGVTDDDLELIADSGKAAGIPFISVGSGPFTAYVVKNTIAPKIKSEEGSILIVIGSVNPMAKAQVDEVLPSPDIFVSMLNPEDIVKSESSKEAAIQKICSNIIGASDNYHIFAVIGSGIDPDKTVDLSKYEKQNNCTLEDLSVMINNSFAKITSEILRNNRNIKAVYTSGGDITVAVCKELNVMGISLRNEILPLAAYGELRGGEYDGLKIITKGGMAGDKYSLRDCIAYLRTHI